MPPRASEASDRKPNEGCLPHRNSPIMPRPRILLLRQPDEPDPYVAAFEAAGFRARCVPVLRFEFVNGAALRERLARPADFGGLVLTSPRAAEAMERAGPLPAGWGDKPAFVVGPATAAAARTVGLRPEGDGAGEGEALAAHIAEAVIAGPFSPPLLFLCGDRRRDALPDRLCAAAVPVEELVVYRTIPEPAALEGLAASPPAWVAFFSPSGVEAALAASGFPWERIARAAIGPTTAAALRDAGHPAAAVAAEPTPAALVSAIAHPLAHA